MEYTTSLEQDNMEGVDADEWNEWKPDSRNDQPIFLWIILDFRVAQTKEKKRERKFREKDEN